MSNQIPIKSKTFDHIEADRLGQDFWSNYHESNTAESTDEGEYRMILPPPNVTGVLHLGHAITVAIEDTLARYHWLSGKKIKWIPGTDHAGIATQVVVEKDLQKEEGLSRHDLGRTEFLRRVWDWKNKNSSTTISQLKTLSPLLDYTKEQFTMNSDLSEEVTRSFIELYNRGKIFRGKRMIDYCCELQTSISNIEIDHIEVDGFAKHTCPNNIVADVGRMYEIAYPIVPSTLPAGCNIDSIVVSTTRPETMFADICVAVHPDDERYRELHGVRLRIPYTNISIPLIYDSVLPKPDMGTGAVKVTPAHDPKDYDLYRRLRTDNLFPLEYFEIIDDTGCINFDSITDHNADAVTDEISDLLNNRNRFIARKILVKQLEQDNYLRSIKPHKTTLNICSRTGDILEPKLRSQWFVDTIDMCERSLKAVETGDLQLLGTNGTPSPIHVNTWRRFLEDSRPWCISRQLWWGHRIPAYQIRLTDSEYSNHPIQTNWIVAQTEEEARTIALTQLQNNEIESDFTLYQDPDVLDTWFSSGIYPFTILGGSVFPQDVLETGKDILFFWVARMVMLSLELRDTLPFSKVYLHHMVRDSEGRKMSKSLGNVIDPLDVIYGKSQKEMVSRIEKSNLSPKERKIAIKNIKKNFPNGIKAYGVDSLRMGLIYYMRQDSDIHLNMSIFKSAHSLLNKVWQILNLYDILNDIETDYNNIERTDVHKYQYLIDSLEDWIDRKEEEFLNFTQYENYDLSQIYDRFYSYVMNYFAPSYLETVKVLITDKTGYYHLDDSTRSALLSHLRSKVMRVIQFLHPMAPNATLMMVRRLGLKISELRTVRDIKPYVSTGDSIPYEHILGVISEINSTKTRDTTLVYWTESDPTLIPWAEVIMHLTRVRITYVLDTDIETHRIKCFDTE